MILLLITVTSILFIYMAIVYTFYTFKQFLLAFVFQMITVLTTCLLFMDALVSAAIFLVVTYYFRLKINSINNLLVNVSVNNRYLVPIINKYITDHDAFCNTIQKFNNFFKDLYLVFIITVFPVSLIVLHSVLFEELLYFLRLFYVVTLVFVFVCLVGIQFLLASNSTRTHKMCKKLSRLQWRINGDVFRIRFKLKLLQCFERLSSDRKLGASIGPLGVMTFPLFYKVCLHSELFCINY